MKVWISTLMAAILMTGGIAAAQVADLGGHRPSQTIGPVSPAPTADPAAMYDEIDSTLIRAESFLKDPSRFSTLPTDAYGDLEDLLLRAGRIIGRHAEVGTVECQICDYDDRLPEMARLVWAALDHTGPATYSTGELAQLQSIARMIAARLDGRPIDGDIGGGIGGAPINLARLAEACQMRLAGTVEMRPGERLFRKSPGLEIALRITQSAGPGRFLVEALITGSDPNPIIDNDRATGECTADTTGRVVLTLRLPRRGELRVTSTEPLHATSGGLSFTGRVDSTIGHRDVMLSAVRR